MKRREKGIEGTFKRDDDETVFRDAMRDVVPMAKSDTVIHVRNEDTKPAPLQNRKGGESEPVDSLSDYISLKIAVGDDWSFLRPGVARQTLRRLRRGYWGIQARLDLHGFTREEARRELGIFLDACSSNGFRCVCVIHGKGLSSKNREPVLKARVGNWLVQRADVLAFCQAGPGDGGSGAVLALLRASTRQ